jgi:hypothetical protein
MVGLTAEQVAAWGKVAREDVAIWGKGTPAAVMGFGLAALIWVLLALVLIGVAIAGWLGVGGPSKFSNEGDARGTEPSFPVSPFADDY